MLSHVREPRRQLRAVATGRAGHNGRESRWGWGDLRDCGLDDLVKRTGVRNGAQLLTVTTNNTHVSGSPR